MTCINMRPPTPESGSTLHDAEYNGLERKNASPAPSESDAQIRDFFERNGLDAPKSRQLCDEHALNITKESKYRPAARQGYCSYTLIMGDNRAVCQFRPPAYVCNVLEGEPSPLEQLPGPTWRVAIPVYVGHGVFCPRLSNDKDAEKTKMSVYVMPIVPGVSLDEFMHQHKLSYPELYNVKKTLVEDMALVFVNSWCKAIDCPTFKEFRERRKPLKIGCSLRERLGWLRRLPGDDLKRLVKQAERDMDEVEMSKACVTHGDLIPANIMVDAETGKFTGLIDWAECEILPLGVGLYGLEEILGHTDPATGLFAYHPFHNELRRHFYATFEALRREKGDRFDESDLRALKLGRRLGMLLWRGIAFEDGRIDRVVEEGREEDVADLHKLRLFLSADDPIPSAFGARARSIWRDRENVVRHPKRLLWKRYMSGGEYTVPDRRAGLVCRGFGGTFDADFGWRQQSGPKQSDRRIFKQS